MCGFTGFLGGIPTHGPAGDEAVLTKMANTIANRGPDDAGYWVDADQRIGLGHRRLAIVDLSAAGHQPMASSSGRHVLAFNGEIYNHMDLRAELDKGGNAPYWRGHSDTETLLAGFGFWGVAATLQRAIGMFAFAVWDREARVLTLGRDRLGEKPLYYGWQGEGQNRVFLFGSELKALKAHPSFAASVDRDALCLMMRHNYIPSPYSIYQGILKLEPGCLLEISIDRPDACMTRYWSAASVISESAAGMFTGNTKGAIDELETLLKSAIKMQMMADVPLGAFLSGGIDSSTVVALMQAQSSRPVKTFTIGFNEAGFNEAEHAKAVARHLGTDHTELYVTAQEAMDVIPQLPSLYCEPFSDSSQIPTYLVSKLARQNVTVSLSGDAGDELFCGYNRYLLADKVWGQLSSIPKWMRHLAINGLTSFSPSRWNSLTQPIRGLLPGSLQHANLGDKLHKAAAVLGSQNSDSLYLGLVSHWNEPTGLVISGKEPPTWLRGKRLPLSGLSHIQRMMALDTVTYLPDDILAKVDRAAMGVSLEGRVPFLDHRVVEFAWRLPQDMKLRNGVTKWALREVLYRHVPKTLIERPKMGFGVPIGDWLRGPLKEWAESLLDETRLRREGFFNPAPIRQKWAEHLSETRNWQGHLWDVLMFQAWLEKEKTT